MMSKAVLPLEGFQEACQALPRPASKSFVLWKWGHIYINLEPWVVRSQKGDASMFFFESSIFAVQPVNSSRRALQLLQALFTQEGGSKKEAYPG